MRLIDADALKNLPFERMIHIDFGDTAIPIEEIDNAPTVEPEVIKDLLPEVIAIIKDVMPQIIEIAKDNVRPQGKWNYIQAGMAVCSFCGASPHKEYKDFCAKCGADMRGEKK